MIGRGIRPVDSEDARSYVRNITGFSMCKSLIFQKIPRFYAQIRPVFTRFYAFLRVRPIFRKKFGFPSPPRDGCPKGVVRWRETWSRKFGLFHKSPRRFTKVRTDQARKSSIVRIFTGETSFRRTDDFWPAMRAWLGRRSVGGCVTHKSNGETVQFVI